MWIFNLFNRLNVYIQSVLTDRALEAVTVILLLCLWSMTIYFWNVLPEQIPTHFDFEGNINGYGEKYTLFITAGVGTLSSIIVGIAAYHPKMINIPVKVQTPRQYFLVCRMARVINVIIVFIFMAVLLNMAAPALGIQSKLISYSDLLISALLLLVIGCYIRLIYKAR